MQKIEEELFEFLNEFIGIRFAFFVYENFILQTEELT